MPGALAAGHELHQFAVPADEEVGGNPQVVNPGVIGMRRRIQSIGEQLLDAIAAEFTGRQADVVDHHQADGLPRRARVAVG
jgi:hypothetical protein